MHLKSERIVHCFVNQDTTQTAQTKQQHRQNVVFRFIQPFLFSLALLKHHVLYAQSMKKGITIQQAKRV